MQLAAVVLFTVQTYDENRIQCIVIEAIEEKERLLCKETCQNSIKIYIQRLCTKAL